MAAAPIGPYTPVVRAGDWIIVSGQLGIKDGAIVPGGVSAQTAQAVENLKGQLASVGATLADISKTLCFLTDMDTFASFNEAYVAGFNGARPARSTIGVAALPFGGAVEIEAWAYKPVASPTKTKAASPAKSSKKSAKTAGKKSPVKKSAPKKSSVKKASSKKASSKKKGR